MLCKECERAGHNERDEGISEGCAMNVRIRSIQMFIFGLIWLDECRIGKTSNPAKKTPECTHQSRFLLSL